MVDQSTLRGRFRRMAAGLRNATGRMPEREERTMGRGLHRRTFMRKTITATAAYAMALSVRESFAQERKPTIPETKQREMLREKEKIVEEIENDVSIGRSVVESTALHIGAFIATMMVNTRPHNGKSRKFDFGGDEVSAASAIIVAPIIEEVLFRAIPSAVINKIYPKGVGKSMWSVGIPISYLFARAHRGEALDGGRDFIPVSQFVSGCFFWYLMRNRGFMHNLTAHAAHNALVEAISRMTDR